MKTVRVIGKQLWNWIIQAKYPCIETWKYWEYEFVDYKCRYKHLKTLFNYLAKNR